MPSNRIPDTHWSYFLERSEAEACATELNEKGLLVRIDLDSWDFGDWDEPAVLLRASWDVMDLSEAHAEIEAIVERHGGFDDGGESGWLDIETGRPVSNATDEFFEMDE